MSDLEALAPREDAPGRGCNTGSQTAIIRAASALAGLWLAAGCAATSPKQAADSGVAPVSVLVVPLQAPPLEVWPDLIEQRQPAYRQIRHQALDFPVHLAAFRLPGGILTSGALTGDDAIASPGPDWSPLPALAERAALTLCARGVYASVAGAIAALPLAPETADPARWRAAIQAWYAAPAAVYPVGVADKVLELGMLGWRTFDDQLSLRLLWKWIDPASGRVTGRGNAERTLVDPQARASLTVDGAAFKSATLKLGGALLDDGLPTGSAGRQ
ncbi:MULTISPECIES: hypothetical protein [Methylomonas]|uniref:Uncharacterized protein n=1 Tax=Methylomonas koyamae TaxID=702114 RepID=A0A177NHH6_9GAMM|nr:hypothetical protein [Methylomonas koyamae]OAI17341.1 hypothetical protein A1355_08145 [Methylomonas koyamae]